MIVYLLTYLYWLSLGRRQCEHYLSATDNVSTISRPPTMWALSLGHRQCEHFSSAIRHSEYCLCLRHPIFYFKDWNVIGECNQHLLHYITLSSFYTPFTPKVTSGASTKLLCTTGSVCECKQMSFQLHFESTRISKFLETNWKIVPSFRSGVGEVSTWCVRAIQSWNEALFRLVSTLGKLNYHATILRWCCSVVSLEWANHI